MGRCSNEFKPYSNPKLPDLAKLDPKYGGSWIVRGRAIGRITIVVASYSLEHLEPCYNRVSEGRVRSLEGLCRLGGCT